MQLGVRLTKLEFINTTEKKKKVSIHFTGIF